jgi:nitrite reductase/ring-hydroxylating ferredoxin subunit
MSRSWVWLILISFFTLSGCGKESDSIPNVFVQYSVTVQEFNIKAVNRVLLVPNHGIKGLMIVASGSGYVAFDRCSSVNPQNGCAVEPDDNGITATDPCTGAKYLLTDGTPQKAPAVRSLKIYTTSFRGGQVINVSN